MVFQAIACKLAGIVAQRRLRHASSAVEYATHLCMQHILWHHWQCNGPVNHHRLMPQAVHKVQHDAVLGRHGAFVVLA